MSRNGTLLQIPASPIFQAMIDDWPEFHLLPHPHPYPRTLWLSAFERLLRIYYPHASSADLRLTARSVAPFYLKDGPNVP
jgi:hypothetical protein